MTSRPDMLAKTGKRSGSTQTSLTRGAVSAWASSARCLESRRPKGPSNWRSNIEADSHSTSPTRNGQLRTGMPFTQRISASLSSPAHCCQKSNSIGSVRFEVGESVKVIDGPFADFSGVVEEVRPDKGTLKVAITIFGRSTSVEMELVQVENLQVVKNRTRGSRRCGSNHQTAHITGIERGTAWVLDSPGRRCHQPDRHAGGGFARTGWNDNQRSGGSFDSVRPPSTSARP